MSTTKPLNPRLRPPLAALPHSRLASDIVLRCEKCVEYLARDGRRRAGAAAAVLDDDAERDARRFGRRKRDEQAVVALPLVDVLLAILLVLRDRDDLRRAGLACDAGTRCRPSACARCRAARPSRRPWRRARTANAPGCGPRCSAARPARASSSRASRRSPCRSTGAAQSACLAPRTSRSRSRAESASPACSLARCR